MFIPGDIIKIARRIQQTWTKLTEAEVSHYLEGKRDQLLLAIQKKYNCTPNQAENALNCIERLA